MNLANRDIVFVLVPTCVYDHGVAGVFLEREDAERMAVELWNQSDGHHRFRIDEREIGKVYGHTFDKNYWNLSQEQMNKDRKKVEEYEGFTGAIVEE